jgi:hypothetical protein
MSPGTATLSRAGHGGGALAATRRWAAMLVLPASILPVVFLGPTLLRAPHKLWRQAGAELQRLEQPSHSRSVSPAAHPAPALRPDRTGPARTAGSESIAHSHVAREAPAPRRARPSRDRRKSR